MADLVITAANVVPQPGYTAENGFAGAALSAGEAVYKNNAALYLPASANQAAPPNNAFYGVALSNAAIGQPVQVLKAGLLNCGNGALTVGGIYVLSGNNGAIAPSADLATGWFTGFVGIAVSSSQLQVAPYASNTNHV